MLKTDVYNLKNEVVGEVNLPETIFGATWKPALVKQVVVAQQANKRKPWAHTKGRGEVRGGGKKPWRQKGTGRARHGSIRSPIWRGGGVTHGPSNERDYTQKVNRKMRKAALASVLSKKLNDHEIKVFDSLALEAPKTKALFSALKPMLARHARAKKLDVLLIPAPSDRMLTRAARNLVKTKVTHAGSLNVYDLLNYKHVYIDKAAVEAIEAHYAREKTEAVTK